MSRRRIANAVRIELESSDAQIHLNLSGAAFTGDWLWVAGDEACGLQRLRRLEPVGRELLRYGDARWFALADMLDLPGAADGEADIEGLAFSDGHLWLAGSHGLKRRNPKDRFDDTENAKRLAKSSLDANRRLLACLPVEPDADGAPCIVREASDGRRAGRLQGSAKSNLLTRLLEDDPHFGPFMPIPGKDNGFDIEGLAVDGDRLLLGLRGPVLRGWSALLEIGVEPYRGGLRLKPLDDRGSVLRKHFLELNGRGLRDLHFSGDDLFMLAGPTMVLDGDIGVYIWPGARTTLAANREPVHFERAFAAPVALPHSRGGDRAEALCLLPDGTLGTQPHWLVLYDAPSDKRQDGEGVVYGDLLRFA